MKTPNHFLFQNEGFLMQGCLKSAIVALRNSVDVEHEPLLYVAFFNFSVGMERLLKLNLILHHCIQSNGAMPDQKTLRGFGHKVADLYIASEGLFSEFNVKVSDVCRLDLIDRDLIQFFNDFAINGRYFNLDDLTEKPQGKDPIPEWGLILGEIYNKDIPDIKRASNEEQVEAEANSLKNITVYLPSTGLSGVSQSYEELFQERGRVQLVSPKVIWRLIKMLYPMKELITALSQELHSPRFQSLEVPFMEEYLDFVCHDESMLWTDRRWPYLT